MDYLLGSVKIMLIVYGLAALISMLVAWVIHLLFAFIRRRRPVTAADAATGAPSPGPGGESGKVA